MGRAKRPRAGNSSALRQEDVPRAGIMQVGDMVYSHLPRGPVRIKEISVEGESVGAIPWVAAEEAQVTTSDGREVSGGMCDPQRLPPLREVEEILIDRRPRTVEEIEQETGWSRADLRSILDEGVQLERLDDSNHNDDYEVLYTLDSERAEEIEPGDYMPWEDRAGAVSVAREGLRGTLSVGDVVSSEWGDVAVTDISVCPPEIKDGPETVSVAAVPWRAAGGRDFAVSLSNGKWAYAEQISPRETNISEEIKNSLGEREQSAEELASRLNISEKDLSFELERLENEEGIIRSRQVFTRNEEYMLYSLA